MAFKLKGPSLKISYGHESAKQQKSNLLHDNPVAKHASALNALDSPAKPAPKKTSYKDAYAKRDQKTYGKMSEEEYTKEAKRQNKSKKDTGKWDAPKESMTKAKTEKTKVKVKEGEKKVETDAPEKAKSKKEIRQENRANRKAGRKARKSERLKKKISKQEDKGKKKLAAGDKSGAHAKAKRVKNLKERKAKNEES
tara:strand:+ start:38 stop:625 length:588 start_codon:yes stop_codon:yes gene_type:complete